MGILWAIIVGFIVGVIARLLMPGKDPAGFVVTTLLGIGGALVGKFVGQALGFYGPEQGAGIFMSVLGALLLLGIYHAIVGRDRTHTAQY